ncbi:MarR family transcriptional regulator [Acetobacter sp. AN02]|uniref:MarR family winged helix-turn-helix transcriptional regulator n=1 Tax=Acetobacter sp. AN02 TaxID=2894186 RepID=UPI00243466C8|nr:MarR family transcriptional regulator [Acetobacter sp. AN02]MDG6095359.1 MarR family transcriptional regulator [Acetobacter sp. AN02]
MTVRDRREAADEAGLLFLRETQIRTAQQLLFLAERDMARSVAPLLEEIGLGRAQYRVLQALALSPGMTVGRLRELLGISKQSLARSLSDLLGRGFAEQRAGRADRRQRLLFLTEAGRSAEERLFICQRGRLVAAYREAGGEAVSGFRRVLSGLLTQESEALLAERGGA